MSVKVLELKIFGNDKRHCEAVAAALAKFIRYSSEEEVIQRADDVNEIELSGSSSRK